MSYGTCAEWQEMISQVTQPVLRSCVATSRWEMNPPRAVLLTRQLAKAPWCFSGITGICCGSLVCSGHVLRELPAAGELPSDARGRSVGPQLDLPCATRGVMAPV